MSDMIHRFVAEQKRANALQEEVHRLRERIAVLESAIENVRLETDWCPLCDGHHVGECK